MRDYELKHLFPNCWPLTKKLTNDLSNDDYLFIISIWQQHVLLNIYHQRFDSAVYSDPESFEPERWLRENKQDIHKMANVVFGFGARSCIGKTVLVSQNKIVCVGESVKKIECI